ncbi:MAG: hypothetical protein ABID09_06130 [Candidatus Omnitrophota bacterium]
MGIKKRTEIKFKQKIKRKKRRAGLSKKGKNPDEHFYSGINVSKRLK